MQVSSNSTTPGTFLVPSVEEVAGSGENILYCEKRSDLLTTITLSIRDLKYPEDLKAGYGSVIIPSKST